MPKTAESEDPELISSHGHRKITAYRASAYENHLSTSRKDFPKVKLFWRNLSEVTGAGDGVGGGPDAETQYSRTYPTAELVTSKQEEQHNCGASPQEARRHCLAWGSLAGVLHQEDKPPENLVLKTSRA